jgi:hypothetical protein
MAAFWSAHGDVLCHLQFSTPSMAAMAKVMTGTKHRYV